MLVSSLPSFLDIYSQSTSSLECKALCNVISFFVLSSICWSSSLVHFKNGPEYLTRRTAQVFIPFIRFCYIVWLLVAFSFFWDGLFKIFSFISTCLMLTASNIPKYLSSSSSCRAASTDIPDPLSPLFPIVHRLWQVLRATSCILT